MSTTVLIADDEEHVRDLYKMIADTIHLKVVGEAANGDQAIELFKQTQPDIMLLDLNMPRKTGDEVLEELQDSLEDTCVIVLTALVSQEDNENCLKLGARTFIRKDTPIYKMAKIINDTWNAFEKEKKEKNKVKYDLNTMLAEIQHDRIKFS